MGLFTLLPETLDAWLHFKGLFCVDVAAVVAIRNDMFRAQVGAVAAAIGVLFLAQVEQELALFLLTITHMCSR